MGAAIFPSGVFLEKSVYCQQGFCVLLGCLFPGILARERKLFLSVPTGGSGQGAFQYAVQEIRKQKEKPGAHCPVA